MKKRFLAALLSLCMTLTMLPTTAFAAVNDSLVLLRKHSLSAPIHSMQ